MKRRDLLSRIAKAAKDGGTELVLEREGGSHSVYSVNGRRLIVPRHAEINELTARGILRDALAAIDPTTTVDESDKE